MNVEIIELVAVIGRLLLGGLFVVGGVHHFFIAPMIADAIDKRGVPFPKFVFWAGTIFQLVAGACLMVGFYVIYAAAGLIGFTLAASVMMLNFWNMQGQDRTNAINGWLSNFAIIGGLLLAMAQAAS